MFICVYIVYLNLVPNRPRLALPSTNSSGASSCGSVGSPPSSRWRWHRLRPGYRPSWVRRSTRSRCTPCVPRRCEGRSHRSPPWMAQGGPRNGQRDSLFFPKKCDKMSWSKARLPMSLYNNRSSRMQCRYLGILSDQGSWTKMDKMDVRGFHLAARTMIFGGTHPFPKCLRHILDDIW